MGVDSGATQTGGLRRRLGRVRLWQWPSVQEKTAEVEG